MSQDNKNAYQFYFLMFEEGIYVHVYINVDVKICSFYLSVFLFL